MSLGFPFGLLALGALVPLAAAYFLRRKQKPLSVSALFLWRDPNPTAEAGPRFERFTRELSFLLEALAIIAAALFLADVRCGAAQEERHVVVVVDGSLSMSAKTASGQVTERVRKKAAEVIDREDATVVSVVESGVSPRVLAGPQVKPSEALSALEKWSPAGPTHDLSPSLLLARELAGPGNRIVLLTDAPLSDATARPAELEVIAVGEPAENVALVAAQRRDVDARAYVTLRLVNFSKVEKQVEVKFHVLPLSGSPVDKVQTVKLGPGAAGAVEVSFDHAGDIELSLPDDALPEDGHATLSPSPEPKVSLQLVSGLDGAAVSALSRFAHIATGVTVGGSDGGVEVSTAQRAVLTVGPRESSADVTIGAPGTQRTWVGPFFAEKSEPLLEDVDLAGIRWTAGDNPKGRGRVTAGPTALLTEDDDGRVHLNLDLSRSNLHRTPAWPVLLSNLVRRARTNVPGLPRHQLLLGEEVPVVTASAGKFVLKGPGIERPVLGVGRVMLPPLSRPGRYVLQRDDEKVDEMEVLPLDARESDLSDRASGVQEASGGEQVAKKRLPQPRNMIPLLAMLALLLSDFWVTRRGNA